MTEDPMTHDELLHDPVLDAWMNDLDDDPNYSDYLTLIARVREDEQQRAALEFRESNAPHTCPDNNCCIGDSK